LKRRNAKIIFADVGDDMNVQYESIIKKITPHTKAIVAVNLGGIPVDDRIFDIDLPIVVDCCQSLGIPQNRGDFACYSFQAIKHFTTFDGGMLVCRSYKDYERAKRLRWFGIDRETKKRVGWDYLINHPMAMNIEEPGYKYHMNDAIASLGLVGIKHSDEILEKRKSLCERYIYHFEGKVKYFCGGSYWMFGIFLDDRNEAILKLREAGIETDLVHLRNDIFDIFGGKKLDLPNMNRLEDKYLYLPMNCKLTFDDIDFVARNVLCLNQ
jgi:dTDP-4-amino-4,6-dideoxygalactose transaminase